ncbi:SPOSA6832_03323, partial [Sporobolomyces salmonicolor]
MPARDLDPAKLEAELLASDGGPDRPLHSGDAVTNDQESKADTVSDPTLKGSQESMVHEEEEQDHGKLEDRERGEEVKVRHRWTIFDPFNFKPPPPPPATMDDAPEIGLASANWLSQLTFSWFTPLLVLGYKRELTATDLPKMDYSREAGHLADVFEQHFDRRRRAIEEWNRALDDGSFVPSRWQRRKWRCSSVMGFGRERFLPLRFSFISASSSRLSSLTFTFPSCTGLYKIVGDLAQTTSPLVTRQIIKFVQAAYDAKQAGEAIPPIGKGVGFAVLLFVLQIIYSIFTANTFSRGGQCGVLARGALIAAAYRKALKLSGKSRVQITNSKLVSHISTDISRIDLYVALWQRTGNFENCSSFFHFSWTCILQLAEVIIILLCTIGVSSLAGIAIVIFAMPLQTYAMRELFKGRQSSMKHTDTRIKTISELLTGIKIIKLFAWEVPMIEKVGMSRKRELGGIRKLLTIRAANQAFALSIPVLASVIVFAVYSVTGHKQVRPPVLPVSPGTDHLLSQDPAEIWTSLSWAWTHFLPCSRFIVDHRDRNSLLNLLRFPLMMLPNSLSTITDAYSACKRLTPVFLADELPEQPIVIVEDAKLAVHVKDADFVWESSAPPTQGKGKKGKKGEKADQAESKEDDAQPSGLYDISLEVPRGSLVCVVGSVGSGKSSLLQGMIGEMRKMTGEVVFGFPPTCFTTDFSLLLYYTLPNKVELSAINATLRANVLFGRPFDEKSVVTGLRPTPGYARMLALLLRCMTYESFRPAAGDLTEVGEKGVVLSGGAFRSLARSTTTPKSQVFERSSLICCVAQVLLDDVLSAVDAHVGHHIFSEAIQGVLKDKTRIVYHAFSPQPQATDANLTFVYLPQADLVVVMENGRIVERGHFAELMKSGGAFSRFARDFGVDDQEKKEEEDTDAPPKKGKEGEGKAATGKAGKALQQKEEQASGNIGFKVWRQYAQAANGFITVPCLVLSLFLMGASQVLSNFALTWWQTGDFGLGQSSYIGLYAGLGISTAVFTFLVGVAAVYFGTIASRRLHHSALARVVRAPMSLFDTTPVGRILNRFAKDTDGIDNRLNDSLRMTLVTVAQIIASIVMIAIVYPIFLAPFAALGLFVWMTSSFCPSRFFNLSLSKPLICLARADRASARTIKRHDNVLRSFLYAWFSESLTGLSTIRAFGEQDRFLSGNEKFIDIENRYAVQQPRVKEFETLTLFPWHRAYLLTVVNQRWLSIRIDSMGALFVFIVAIVAVAERTSIPSSKTGLILSFLRQTAEVENNMASVERLCHYSNELEQEAPPQIAETSPPPTWPDQGAVSIKNIELRYRPELPPVLRNVSLDIRPGEKIGVVGRTGAGKSSLTLALFRMVEISSGQISVDGIDISKLGLTQLRERLSIIPQDPLLFNGTLRSNLDPFNLYDDARLWDALRRSWLVEREAAVDGSGQVSRFTLDTAVEDEGANMSVGERSLVSLARALVKDARIVVLECAFSPGSFTGLLTDSYVVGCCSEATASVDLSTDARIQATIRSEFKDKTLICIAHRIATIINYDRILVLSKGAVEAFDTPLALFDEAGDFHSNISREDIIAAQRRT